MTNVWSDPEKKFAVDWDWGRRFTVWTLTGRPAESRYSERVLDRELPSPPSGEKQAAAEARRWWRAQGHSEVLDAASR